MLKALLETHEPRTLRRGDVLIAELVDDEPVYTVGERRLSGQIATLLRLSTLGLGRDDGELLGAIVDKRPGEEWSLPLAPVADFFADQGLSFPEGSPQVIGRAQGPTRGGRGGAESPRQSSFLGARIRVAWARSEGLRG